MARDRVRYRLTFRIETDTGFHQSATRTAETLWELVQEMNNVLADGAEILAVDKECWTRAPLDTQEKDTIEMLTHGRVKL